MGKAAAVKEKVREVGEVVGPKAHEMSEAMKPKVKQARRKVGFWIAGESPKKTKKWPAIVAAGIGAMVAFFMDPISGKTRRDSAKGWAASKIPHKTPETNGSTPT